MIINANTFVFLCAQYAVSITNQDDTTSIIDKLSYAVSTEPDKIAIANIVLDVFAHAWGSATTDEDRDAITKRMMAEYRAIFLQLGYLPDDLIALLFAYKTDSDRMPMNKYNRMVELVLAIEDFPMTKSYLLLRLSNMILLRNRYAIEPHKSWLAQMVQELEDMDAVNIDITTNPTFID